MVSAAHTPRMHARGLLLQRADPGHHRLWQRDPKGLAANLLTVEALFGVIGFALSTGLLLSRFSFQSVHVRSSYKPDEVTWGARFADMFVRREDGLVGIDLRKLHDVEPAP